ncbi:MAG: type II toxin-antitoxin system prevent-host-death family antitoxin [Microbacterium sp.]|nr:MAG: type II toxin-antitoxin system prevent-host-death family antitoxin [Microbacterium sp.]
MINVQDAKTRLSELLHRVEAGERIVLARAGRPVARLEAVDPPRRSFEAPLLTGIPPLDPAEVLAASDASQLAEWESGHAEDPFA